MDLINRIIHALTELHPTHPMFVHFPIALTGAAFFLFCWLIGEKIPPSNKPHLQILCWLHWVRLPQALPVILII